MRPPPKRNFLALSNASANRIGPRAGAPPGPTAAPVSTYYCPENTTNLLTQTCIHGYEKQALPLLGTNRFRGTVTAGFHHHPPQASRLVLRKENAPRSRPLVKTYE